MLQMDVALQVGERRNAPAATSVRKPRYVEMADDLIRAIENGTYPTGSTLLPELELCAKFNVSRFTARAALAVLQRQGFITRRPKVGTVVIARNPQPKYSVLAHNTADLLRFSESTDLHTLAVDDIEAEAALALDLGCEVGEPWIKVATYRTSPESSQQTSWTEFYLRPEHRSIVPQIGAKSRPVYALIEKFHGKPISRIDQRIEACLVPKVIADILDVPPRSAALKAVYRLHTAGDQGRFYAAIGLYPAQRFHLAQTLTRED
jgi:GntR family transcriptional regulator